jgi:hypothetical protein
MVLNPSFYVSANHYAKTESRKLHATARRYLLQVEHALDALYLSKSLQHHNTKGKQPALSVEHLKFPEFYYPFQEDNEWAIEFAGLVEKTLGKNSQAFIIEVNRFGRLTFQGADFVGGANYNWNPPLDKINEDLRKFVNKRRQLMITSRFETRSNIRAMIVTDSRLIN